MSATCRLAIVYLQFSMITRNNIIPLLPFSHPRLRLRSFLSYFILFSLMSRRILFNGTGASHLAQAIIRPRMVTVTRPGSISSATQSIR
jgi:hypothetical protein